MAGFGETQPRRWRRGSESNRRMRLLQSPALPLGYPATGRAWKSNPLQRARKSSFASFDLFVCVGRRAYIRGAQSLSRGLSDQAVTLRNPRLVPIGSASMGSFWNPTPGCLQGRRLNPIGLDSPAAESGFRGTDNSL